MTKSSEDDPDELSPRLRRYRAPELTERLVFRVDNEPESDYQEAGPCVVAVDSRQIEIHFEGDSRHRWTGTWTDLRWLLARIEGERQEALREADAEKLCAEHEARQQEAKAKKKQRIWNEQLKRRKSAAAPLPKSP